MCQERKTSRGAGPLLIGDTYYAARLQQKHTCQWKNIQLNSLKICRPWYRQALASCWRNISAKDSLTKTRNMEHSFTSRRPPSCLQSRHFRFYPPLPSQVFLVGWQFLFFKNRKIKTRFSFWISPALILFPAVSLHMKLLCQVWIFNKLEFRE